MDNSRAHINSKIVLNCSTNFSSLRIEDPKKDDDSNNIPRYIINAVPQLTRYFTLHEKIGEGTFSKVYRAKLVKDSSKEYALKCVVPTIKFDRVATELRYLRDLGGDCNIIGVKTCFYGNGFSVIVMPFFKHDHFMDVMKVMNASEIRDYMKNLFIALAKVHRCGIIHRDIKPSNFLYNRALKKYGLVDFGLAQTEKSMVSYSKLIQSQFKDKTNLITRPVLKDMKATKNYDLTKDYNLILVKKRNFEEIDNVKNQTKRLKIAETKSGLLHAPSTPKKGESKCDNSSFRTPVKKSTTKENLATPIKESPMRVIPDTPPHSLCQNSDVIKTPIRCNLQKDKIDTPVSRTENKNSSNGTQSNSCGCFSKGRVCRTCAKRVELIAPRAGTPGFRAPEVLLRHLNQTTAIDIWSAGVIMASLLSRRYPFFRNIDDLTSLAEIITLLGTKRVQKAAKELNRTLALSVKVLPPLDLKTVCETLRNSNDLVIEESAYDLLNRLLEPNPTKRLTAEEALRHPFILSSK